LALEAGIVELVSVARGQHARSTIKIREISALQRGGVCDGESCERGHEDTNDEGFGC
jgi:hypothetical protein